MKGNLWSRKAAKEDADKCKQIWGFNFFHIGHTLFIEDFSLISQPNAEASYKIMQARFCFHILCHVDKSPN